MVGLIMAGGVGSRFWPLSREKNPKQFLKIVSEFSMIQMTVNRLLKKLRIEDIYIVTSQNQVELVKEHLPELPIENIIIEPFGRNTAPCIGLSAKYLESKYPADEQILVCPADHVILEEDHFWEKVEQAEEYAKENFLVTFGIKPTYPATGYGYIEASKQHKQFAFHVKQFKEKPDLDTAKMFLDSGNFYWNSGMFLWRIDTIISQFKMYLPKIQNLLNSIGEKWENDGSRADISSLYDEMPKIPVDIGIMEQAKERLVVPVEYSWSDVGSWKALYDISKKDVNKNVVYSDWFGLGSSKNLVYTDKFVAMIGIENLVVIETDDALLIANKEETESVKKIVEVLKKEDKSDLL